MRFGALLCIVLGGVAAISGCSGELPEVVESPPVLSCEAVAPAPANLRLLTRVQYDNTIADLLGVELGLAAASFPPENTVMGFGNNADAHRVSPLLIEKYLDAGEKIAVALSGDRLAELLPCSTSELDAECAAELVSSLGKRAFRRPLTGEEAQVFNDLFAVNAVKYGALESISLVIQALVQSPQFLYRIDSFSAPTPESGAVQLGSYEMASRLSYFLTNSMPDAELMLAADRDELRTSEQIEAAARRLLATDRARAVSLDFHRQWLGLGRIPGIVRDGATPVGDAQLDPDALPAAWQASVERFLTDVLFDQGGTLKDLFTSPVVYVDGNLAALYGVEGAGSEPSQLRRVEFDAEERAGLLTQPGLLALFAHPDQSAPIQRGVFLREQILCQPIEAPPPFVDQTPPDPDPSLTTRERFAEHTAIPGCAECHNKIDGLGFGLENYDHLGRFREDEFGLPVDASGEVKEAREEALNGRFHGAVELAKRLAQSTQVENCVATQWYRYATGRVETEADLCSLEQIQTAFTASGGSVQELMVAITLSDAFRFRTPGEQDGAK